VTCPHGDLFSDISTGETKLRSANALRTFLIIWRLRKKNELYEGFFDCWQLEMPTNRDQCLSFDRNKHILASTTRSQVILNSEFLLPFCFVAFPGSVREESFFRYPIPDEIWRGE